MTDYSGHFLFDCVAFSTFKRLLWPSAIENQFTTRMWANVQCDGRPVEYRWHSLFNAANFG